MREIRAELVAQSLFALIYSIFADIGGELIHCQADPMGFHMDGGTGLAPSMAKCNIHRALHFFCHGMYLQQRPFCHGHFHISHGPLPIQRNGGFRSALMGIPAL